MIKAALASFAVLMSSANVAHAEKWLCNGFGYAYNFSNKTMIYSDIQSYSIQTNGIPRKDKFELDWRQQLTGELTRAGSYTKVVTQNCENDGTYGNVRSDLGKIKSKYRKKGFYLLPFRSYSYPAS